MPKVLENKKMIQQVHHPEFNRKVAIIIAFRDFRDEEYFIPKEILESAGVKTTTASTSLGKAIGVQGNEAEVTVLLDNLNPADFDAILFIGGSGAYKLIDNEHCHQIAKEAVSNNKVLAAICVAPAILAKAGVLFGKKATVWSSPLDKSAVNILKENGAVYSGDDVVVDEKIITASGPQVAKEFANTLLEMLK